MSEGTFSPVWLLLFGLRHAKTCLRAYADSEGPDQTAHPRSLIRAFTVRQQIHWILQTGEQRPVRYLTHAQDDLNAQCVQVRRHFSHDRANLVHSLYSSASVSQSTLDRPVSRSVMHAGNCTALSTESSLMAKCPVTRRWAVVMIPSTPSSVRLELGNTSQGQSS